MSEDPARDETNWYAYCGNNPLARVDPTGLNPIAGALIGGVSGAASKYAANTLVKLAQGGGLESFFVSESELEGIGYSALEGVVAGAVSGGLSSIKSIKNAIDTVKVAKAAVTAVSTSTGSVVSTVTQNVISGDPLTKDVAGNALLAGTVGAVTGGIAKPGMTSSKIENAAIKTETAIDTFRYVELAAKAVARDTIISTVVEALK